LLTEGATFQTEIQNQHSAEGATMCLKLLGSYVSWHV